MKFCPLCHDFDIQLQFSNHQHTMRRATYFSIFKLFTKIINQNIFNNFKLQLLHKKSLLYICPNLNKQDFCLLQMVLIKNKYVIN